MEFRTAGVIGAGAWGTALAQVCARAGLEVVLQAREPEVIDSIAARRVNEAFLPGVELDPAIRADLQTWLRDVLTRVRISAVLVTHDVDEALVVAMSTAGRTVLFSAVTVALSMAAMLLFPMYFLKSFAYAGIATVGFAAAAAVLVTPAAIYLLGDRLDALDVRAQGPQPPDEVGVTAVDMVDVADDRLAGCDEPGQRARRVQREQLLDGRRRAGARADDHGHRGTSSWAEKVAAGP